jgi:hypothetical protein
MDEQENEYLQQMQEELNSANKDKRQLANAQLSLFGGEQNDNLIKWQLDLDEYLDKVYHLLRGDSIKQDENGNLVYAEASNNDLKPFNDFGTQLVMNLIQFYLNRNTILSNYDEATILNKVYDFGIRLSDLVHNRYEDMMMTTNFEDEFENLYPELTLTRDAKGKMFYTTSLGAYYILDSEMVEAVNRRLDEHILGKLKMAEIVCGAIVDNVHSAFNRALNGGELKSLREARTVSQNDSGFKNPNYPVMDNQKRGIFRR